MTIDLRPTTEALLKQEAARQGRPPSAVANDLLASALAESARDFDETVEGIECGLQAGVERRERPLADYIADVQQRRLKQDSTARG